MGQTVILLLAANPTRTAQPVCVLPGSSTGRRSSISVGTAKVRQGCVLRMMEEKYGNSEP
ncbi:hypothetical protein VU08_08845 [Desulfobulbus sp. F5]|nr:hypothetical protein [Desulfobulbus sp. F5]